MLKLLLWGYNFLTKLGITDLEVKINSVGSKGSRTITEKNWLNTFNLT